jgi:hypothetical protein
VRASASSARDPALMSTSSTDLPVPDFGSLGPQQGREPAAAQLLIEAIAYEGWADVEVSLGGLFAAPDEGGHARPSRWRSRTIYSIRSRSSPLTASKPTAQMS